MFKPTHRDVFSEIEIVEEGAMKLEPSGQWVSAVFYRGSDGQLRATTRHRFAERFSEIPIAPLHQKGPTC